MPAKKHKKVTKTKASSIKTLSKAKAPGTKITSKAKPVKTKVLSNAKNKTKKTIKHSAKRLKKSKSVVEITIKRRITNKVPETYHFYLNDGRCLSNIAELIDALDSMSDEVFHHHVRHDANDFANWVRDIIKEDLLAEELMHAKNKMEMQLKLLKHIVKDIKL